jgi:parvulin-like peptidyl-prolyl isomerase
MHKTAFSSFLVLASLTLAAQNPQVPQATGAAAENKIVGRVGNVIYRESDFYQYLPIVYQEAQLEQVMRSPDLRKEAQKSFLESMVLVNQAKKEGIDKLPEFQAKLAGVINTLMIQEYVNKNVPMLQRLSSPTEEQVKAHYDENVDSFKAQDNASARHILVAVRSSESDTDKPTDEEAKAKALLIKDELLNGKGWQEAASEYSDDPGSKDNGGLYENFDPARMVPEFAEAVRTQEIGQVGEPIRTSFGYHIIRVEDRQQGEIRPFDEVRATIQQQLTERMRNDTWVRWINSLKAELGYAEGEDAVTGNQSSTTDNSGTASVMEPGGDKK